MKIKGYLHPLLLVGTVLALIQRLLTKAFTAKLVSNRITYEAIDAFLEGQRRRLNIPGISLAIVEGDQVAHLRGFGRARPGGEAPTPHTPFFIGSLTKSFTALAIMQLVEAGKVDLDAPVQRYLPWFRIADPRASAQMTLRLLLNQTSSLPVWPGELALADFDDHLDATERQARALSTLNLTRPVGSQFEYSNTNYNILGLIIEAASGESYSDYIQRYIFDPLDMQHSYTSKAAAQQDGLAVGHRYWMGFPIPAPGLSIPRGSLPSGQLISSAEDMAHYLIANLNAGGYCGTQILSEAGIAELHRPAVEWKEMGLSVGYYGMGWISQDFGDTEIVSHSGIVPDFGAFMALIPDQKKGLVLLFNANHALMKMTLDEVGMQTAQMLAGERPTHTIWGSLYWGMRGMLLVPLLQITGVAATLRLLRCWRVNPALCPSRRRLWRRHILLPLLPNLIVALSLVPMLGKMRAWLRLFMPDYTWIALISGSFSLFWSFLRPGLILKTLHISSTSINHLEDTIS